jgi:hypothetical protein
LPRKKEGRHASHFQSYLDSIVFRLNLHIRRAIGGEKNEDPTVISMHGVEQGFLQARKTHFPRGNMQRKEQLMSMTQEEPGAFASSVKETPAVTATGTNAAVGVYASSDSGTAVRADCDSGTAIYGHSVSDVAVFGVTSMGEGVFGTSSSSGVGVHGFSTSGQAVLGLSTHGTAIYGSSENGMAGGFDGNVQVKGNLSLTGNNVALSVASSGVGVSAEADAGYAIFGHSKGSDAIRGASDILAGVFGRSDSGVGVFGTSESGLAGQFDGNVQVTGNLSVASSVKEAPAVKATGTNAADGVRADSDSGYGVFGNSSTGTGVLGVTQSDIDGIGVEGVSTFGLGVYGHCASGTGVYGETNGGIGVKGLSALTGTGVQGFGKFGIGVSGSSEASTGVFGRSDSGTGVFGTSSSGLAGQFEGNVHVSGDFSVTGNKAFVQAHPTDPTREIVYVALEGGEAGTYVRGSGQLQSGKAVLTLPEHFGLVTENSGLTVQLTPRGEWLQLYVVELDTSQLVVREAQGKSGAFDYLIQGVRRGSEQHEVIRTKR